MKVLGVLVLVAVASAFEYADEWKAWKEVYIDTNGVFVVLIVLIANGIVTYFQHWCDFPHSM